MYKRMPKEAFDKWRRHADEVGRGKLMNRLNAQSLNRLLSSIPQRTLKDSY